MGSLISVLEGGNEATVSRIAERFSICPKSIYHLQECQCIEGKIKYQFQPRIDLPVSGKGEHPAPSHPELSKLFSWVKSLSGYALQHEHFAVPFQQCAHTSVCVCGNRWVGWRC